MEKISTLADANREGWQIWAHCTNEYCARGKRLDIDALIHRFGSDHSIINETEITRRLRCECGHKGAMLHFRPPNGTEPTIPSSSSPPRPV